MPFSKLFSLILAIGIIPVLIGSLIGIELYVFLLYNLIAVLLLIIDYVITPGSKQFEIERICDEKLSMGTENEIVINIRNNSDYNVNIEAVDEVPEYMELKSVL